MNNSTFVVNSSADRTSIEECEPVRLLLYRNAIQHCLQNVSSAVTIDEFSIMFQNIPSFKGKKHIISNFYNILTKYINESVYQRVEEHIEDENLGEKFSILEKLIIESEDSKGKTAWRPSHDVHEDLKSNRIQEKIAFKEELERMVINKEGMVNKLKDDIIKAENEAKKLEAQMNEADHILDSLSKYVDNYTKYDDIASPLEEINL